MGKNKLGSVAVLALTLALVGAIAFMPQTAYAEGGGGSGSLIAEGDGLAGLRGNGEVTISGAGILWIRDLGGDAVINVTGKGRRIELPSGWIQYIGFNGEAHVSGSQITVALSGVNIHLEANGTGQFLLRGSGWFQVGDSIRGEWTSAGQVLELSPSVP
jgi:hypothetical protein